MVSWGGDREAEATTWSERKRPAFRRAPGDTLAGTSGTWWSGLRAPVGGDSGVMLGKYAEVELLDHMAFLF